jgi:hypothetical protein
MFKENKFSNNSFLLTEINFVAEEGFLYVEI